MISVVIVTSRKDNRLEWLFESIARQIPQGEQNQFQFIVVDRFADEEGRKEATKIKFQVAFGLDSNFVHLSPKPTPWQGSSRLTKEEYFSPANARNTGLCLAKGEYVIFADDISVALPTWLAAAQNIVSRGEIALGAYRKVKSMEVSDGLIKAFEDHPSGHDCRWHIGRDDSDVEVPPGMLFGCSVGGPIEAFLSVNGFDERCDAMGIGGEDTMMGLMLQRRGHKLMYSRRMLTYESEELHHIEQPLKRVIQKIEGREDASWEMLRKVRDTNCDYAPNYFPDGGIRLLRGKMLNGQAEWPAPLPEHEWYSGRKLSEL
jgi:hypothetical protein